MNHLLLAKCFNKQGRLISSAYNLPLKSHPLQLHFAKQVGLPLKDKLHSEILALIRSKEQKVHKITVERYGKSGRMLLSKPCPICQAGIKDWGVREVEYTTEDGWVTEYLN